MTATGCLEPEACPVPDPNDVDLRRLRLARRPAGTLFHTAYRSRHWPALFNASGSGNARFSPLSAAGEVVPALYVAATQTVALLESVFHDVHAATARINSEPLELAPRGLVSVVAPRSLALIDLSDQGLARLGLDRGALIATTPAHYPCTQEWAAALHRRRIGGVAPDGILWRSRIAELAQADSPLLGDLLAVAGDACVLFGDRVPSDPAGWDPGDPHYDDLTAGGGRILAEQTAEQLGAVIVPI